MTKSNKCEVGGTLYSTPSSATMSQLMGIGASYLGVAITRTEFKNLKRIYKIHPEDHPLAQSGAMVSTMRQTARDGFRLMAALSKYVETGEDPVKVLVRALSEAGYDVPNDIDWAYDEDPVEVNPDYVSP